jgi:hypothetical protein
VEARENVERQSELVMQGIAYVGYAPESEVLLRMENLASASIYAMDYFKLRNGSMLTLSPGDIPNGLYISLATPNTATTIQEIAGTYLSVYQISIEPGSIVLYFYIGGGSDV